MNTTVRQPAAVDVAMTQTKQSQTSKEQNVEDGKFMNMLSNAMNNKPAETVKPPESEKKTESTANESDEPLTQENSETETPVMDQEDGMAYDDQNTAVAVAMQMQGMLPAIRIEEPEEIELGIDRLLAQADQPKQAMQAEVAAAEVFQPNASQVVSNSETKAETVTEETQKNTEIPKTAEIAPEEKPLAVQEKPETTAPRIAETEDAPERNINMQEHQAQTIRPEAEQRQTVSQRPVTASEEQVKDVAEVTDTDSETETVKQPVPSVPTHNVTDPRESETAQTKFDGMLERASRELNRNVTVQTVQTEVTTEVPEEVTEETPIIEQPVNTEAKPQETAKQEVLKAEAPKAETVKAEVKVTEEVKPQEQATVQKSVKAPVTEQRPQKEISQADESLLSMAQQKIPEIKHEVIRSEPIQQPHQPQAQGPDQAEQVKAQVLRNMENKRTEFQMQLQPEELGKVNVKMVLEGGKLSVEIAAVNPKSAEMLSRQAESLASSLRASGADVTSVTVVTSTESSSAQMNGEYDPNNFQNRFREQGNGQNQNGRRGRADGTGEREGNVNQTEREAPKAPQRILNYSV